VRISWPKIYAELLRNVGQPWYGMLPYFAESLGVTEASISALGVGFAPLVQFKKRISANWWVIPERDAEGNIVGLSLRADRDGTKVMYPGSKHGLVYAIRPGFKTGSKDYTPGKHNWVRTMDAGVPCPVCGKPDGCLLSAEDPKNPKAVKCIRESQGAVAQGDMDSGGHLHILKPEGHLVKGGPLLETPGPGILVEGASDTAVAMDLGFVAVGRPSNLAGLGYLKQLVKGREWYIIGENDLKADGKHPGKAGMEAVFETLKNCCKLKKFLPPADVKDLREWKQKHNLTREDLLKYAEHNGSDISDNRNLESKEPVSIASRWLKEEHTTEGIPVLRKYAKEWYRFNGERYEKVDEEAYIRSGLYRWLLGRAYMEENLDGGIVLKPYEADKSKITNIIDALLMECPLIAEPPCWLDGRTEPHPTGLVSFPNGVLDVYPYLAGESAELLPLSPLYFTFNGLPYNFDPKADCPLFKKFIQEILPGDAKKIRLLQEWMGYLILPKTDQQKFMVFNGPSGSGKTTLLGAIEAMLGSNQVCHPSLMGMGQEYGLGQFIGKLWACIGDAHLDPMAKKQVIMERLKELTGNVHPKLMVRRMHIAEEDVHIYARITLACNDLPDLPDSGGALPRRTLALAFTEKFETETRKPDRQLADKLATEAPGIFNWALEGLDRLTRQGYFTIPESSEELAKKFAANASPISQFVDYCCEVGSHRKEQDDVVYDVWRNWGREHGLSGGMRLKFNHNLLLTLSSVRHVKDNIGGKIVGVFTGIGLTKEAREKYLAK